MFLPLATTLFLASLPLPAVAAPTAPAPAEDASKPPPAWLSRVNAGEPGAFPLPRSFAATYGVSWGGLDAAKVESRCTSPDANGNLQLSVQISTTGLARSLYTLDATHLSVVNRRTLHPVRLEQTEKTSSKKIVSRVDFTPQEAVRTGTPGGKKSSKEDDTASSAAPKPSVRRYPYPGLYDMNSALLQMRSLPMKTGDEKTLVLMTANSPYLATIKVVGRSRVRVKAGEFPAIECSLALEKVNKSGELEPRKGFKTAHAWLTDDADRLLLKVEAQVFVGTVDLELTRVKYADPAAPVAR